ncbi:hypothetical protein DFH09DRAFT_1093985 [Mycena vulgaris]|nr:hypothetical protein DFH09DRAFT_1093985 [Mycena vulgaris]
MFSSGFQRRGEKVSAHLVSSLPVPAVVDAEKSFGQHFNLVGLEELGFEKRSQDSDSAADAGPAGRPGPGTIHHMSTLRGCRISKIMLEDKQSINTASKVMFGSSYSLGNHFLLPAQSAGAPLTR